MRDGVPGRAEASPGPSTLVEAPAPPTGRSEGGDHQAEAQDRSAGAEAGRGQGESRTVVPEYRCHRGSDKQRHQKKTNHSQAR